MMSIKKITAKKERLKKRFADRIDSANTNERKTREEKKKDDKILEELRKSSSFNHTHYVKALYNEKPLADPNQSGTPARTAVGSAEQNLRDQGA